MSENRFISFSFGIVVISIGSCVGFFFGGWAWLIAALIISFGWMSIKVGLRSTEEDLEQLTGDKPAMSDEALGRFVKKINNDDGT